MTTLFGRRVVAIGTLATGVVCPCHVLVGLVGLATGGVALSPAAQDGIHAVYVPVAVLVGALLLRLREVRPPSERRSTSPPGGGG